jgi:pilus assembly protein CpaE
MATQVLPIVILSTDFENLIELRTALSADSRVKLLSGGNDVEQLHEEVLHLKPAAALICLGPNADQEIRLIQRLKSDCPQTAVISAARETSADRILQSLRAGAQEFLRLPVDGDELRTVLDRIGEFSARQAEAAKKIGRMTAVFSNKGGCGTSFIAANLAASASASAKTVLVDLNLEAGDLPMFFGSNPKASIADLVSRKGRLDDHIISAFVTPYSDKLHLLAAPKEVDPIDKIKPEHVFEVLQRLRECYEYVVLDLQHTFDAITLAALEQSDNIVLVLTLDLLAIRSAKRALQIFDRAGYARNKVRILVNRWSKQLDLDIRQVEEVLGEPVLGSLLSDYQTVVNSINQGVPLIDSQPRCKIAKEIVRMAQVVSVEGGQAAAEVKPRRSWSFFLRRQTAD